MADPAVSAFEHGISFGPFRLIPKQRLLLEGTENKATSERPFSLRSRKPYTMFSTPTVEKSVESDMER